MARRILLCLVAAATATLFSQGAAEATIGPREAELIVATSIPVNTPEDIPPLLRQHEVAIRTFLMRRWPTIEVSTAAVKTTIGHMPPERAKLLFKHVESAYRGWRPAGRRCWVRGHENLYVVDLPYVEAGSPWKLDKGEVIIGVKLPKTFETHTEQSHTAFEGGQPVIQTQVSARSEEGVDLLWINELPQRFNADRSSLRPIPRPLSLQRYHPVGDRETAVAPRAVSDAERVEGTEEGQGILPIGPFALHLLVDRVGNIYIDQIRPWAQRRPYKRPLRSEGPMRWGAVNLQEPDE